MIVARIFMDSKNVSVIWIWIFIDVVGFLSDAKNSIDHSSTFRDHAIVLFLCGEFESVSHGIEDKRREDKRRQDQEMIKRREDTFNVENDGLSGEGIVKFGVPIFVFRSFHHKADIQNCEF